MSTPSVADRLVRIRALEEQRSVIAAEQAREVAALMAQTRAAAPDGDQLAMRQRVAEIARARRVSPATARPYVVWAEQAPVDTPAVFALLQSGQLSEKRARIVFDAVAPLPPADRRRVDADIADRLGDADGWGDRRIETETVKAVQTHDPRGALRRAVTAASRRRVTTRSAPDVMGRLELYAPKPQVLACRQALEQAAAAAKAAGDPRSREQIMADTAVERLTGQTTAGAVPLSIQLVITDRTLLGASDLPARLVDGTPIPAPLARAMVLDTETARRVRRLFCDPMGRLVTAETDSRVFTKAMAEFIVMRDGGTCTEAWCDAPIRHADHIHPASRGGPTSLSNGRGTCAWCNHTKSDQISAPGPARPHHRRRRRSRLQSRAARLINTARREQRREQRRGVQLRRPPGHVVVDLAHHRGSVQRSGGQEATDQPRSGDDGGCSSAR